MTDDSPKPLNIKLDNVVTSVQLKELSENRKEPENLKTETREEWNNKVEFVLSIIGYAVGLGNVWRFPYLAYKHGGGSFLIPYIIMLFGTGLPLFFMELALGQYAGQGPTKIFGRLAPAFKGLGFAMLLVAFLVSIYYNMIIAWSLFYLGNGFSSVLPWSNGTNATEFFNHVLLGLDKAHPDLEEFGELRWQLVICLFSAWAIVGICLIKGVHSVGKAVYVTGNEI